MHRTRLKPGRHRKPFERGQHRVNPKPVQQRAYGIGALVTAALGILAVGFAVVMPSPL